MKIIQVADFHFSGQEKQRDIHSIAEALFRKASLVIQKSEKLLFCSCGDIFDKGNAKGKQAAKWFFDKVKNLFNDFELSFEFVPGNHDIVNGTLQEFDSFIKPYISGKGYSFSKENVIVRNYQTAKIFLASSITHYDHSYGLVNLKEFEKKTISNPAPKILVMHHTLLSRYKDDLSPIRDSYHLVKIINDAKAIALLHGHTHGYSQITIGKKCKVIGVGPFFKEIPGINKQFNIISITGNTVSSISNFYFRKDLGEFSQEQLFNSDLVSRFSSKSLTEVHEEIQRTAKDQGSIPNFILEINNSVPDFLADINKNYKKAINQAKEWLEPSIPQTLYYNHGTYLNKGGIEGIQHLITELKNKPTSSRAIISLINMTDITGRGDGFLPALNIIQCSFDNLNKERLRFSLYLRALEVKHFLPINIAEISIILQEICKYFPSLKEVQIFLTAFRAQFKDRFGCHRKVKLDLIKQPKFMTLLKDRNISEITKMLREKRENPETVVIDSGILNFQECITEFVQSDKDKFYPKKILKEMANLKGKIDELRKLREKTSIYQEIENAERDLLNQIEVVEKTFSILGV
ncbi:MAG: metallophosphoesterase [Candidatus Ozemobacteraceae bacterium]